MRYDIERMLFAYPVDQVDAIVGIINYMVNEGIPNENVSMEDFLRFAKYVSLSMHTRFPDDLNAELKERRKKEARSKPPTRIRKQRERKKEEVEEAERRRLEEILTHKYGTVVGFCPKCGDTMTGHPTKICEKTKTGRQFHKECSSCTYYVEIWKKGDKFIETEGG